MELAAGGITAGTEDYMVAIFVVSLVASFRYYHSLQVLNTADIITDVLMVASPSFRLPC
jgi:hypothetical protein